jgi:hypothetical protein
MTSVFVASQSRCFSVRSREQIRVKLGNIFLGNAAGSTRSFRRISLQTHHRNVSHIFLRSLEYFMIHNPKYENYVLRAFTFVLTMKTKLNGRTPTHTKNSRNLDIRRCSNLPLSRFFRIKNRSRMNI